MQIEDFLSRLQGVQRKGKGWLARCPAHNDPKPSLSISEKDGKLLLYCFAGCPTEAVVAALGLEMKDLFPYPAPAHSKNSAKPKPKVTRYEIRNAQGQLEAIHERVDKPDGSKTFMWHGPDGSLALGGRAVSSLPLYGSEKLAQPGPGSRVVVVEGEKAAASLMARGIPAVGTVCGAGVTPDSEVLRYLLPFAVILWTDNDEPGRQHMAKIAAELRALGHHSIKVVSWPEAPEKGDAADFLGTDDELKELLNSAVAYTPPTTDLAALLVNIERFIKRYVILSDAQVVTLALWVSHTHAFAAADVTPYLHVYSAEKRSGKSRLLEALSFVVANPWSTARVTAAVLVRKVAREKPTLLLDESDAAFRGNREYSEALRGILNGGWRRGGVASVCEKRRGDWVAVDFETFSPKAIAGIGKLPDTVADRSIPINMKRRGPGENVSRFHWREVKGEAASIAEALSTWASGAIPTLREAWPKFPVSLDDRAVDIWEPLLAIADLAGGEWPENARSAAKELSGNRVEEDDSIGVRLLVDIKAIFEERKVERLSSGALVEALLGVEESGWGTWRLGKGLDQAGLAKLLKPFGVKPMVLRFGEDTARGYERGQFEESFQRYLHIPEKSVTPVTGVTFWASRFKKSGSEDENVTGVTPVTPPGGISVDSPLVAEAIRLGGRIVSIEESGDEEVL
ncbi:MAG: DUF3631 domain-containing protein [Chloroflexi bacterium]|nr:DUF3631 domain-containing protein [Chloroflexota bacterium]